MVRVQAFPICRGQRHRTRFEPVGRVAVKIRAAGKQKIQVARDGRVLLNQDRVVVGVKCLDGVQS